MEFHLRIFNWFTHFVLPSQRGCTESTMNISTFPMNSANSFSIFTKYLNCSAVNGDSRCLFPVCSLLSVLCFWLSWIPFLFPSIVINMFKQMQVVGWGTSIVNIKRWWQHCVVSTYHRYVIDSNHNMSTIYAEVIIYWMWITKPKLSIKVCSLYWYRSFM